MDIGDYFTYRGPEAVNVFLKKIIDLTEQHMSGQLGPKPELNSEDWDRFRHATSCYLCGGHFVENEKVRDHCHYCSRYRGAAHYDCNRSYRLQNKVQVVFHNLKPYDGHLIMQQIGTLYNGQGLQLECIAKETEDYTSSLNSKNVAKRQSQFCKHNSQLSEDAGFILDGAMDGCDMEELREYEEAIQEQSDNGS